MTDWTVDQARRSLQLERPAEIRLGLERLQAVLARLDHPERSAPAVLVAGTNGKGSTCAYLAAVLRRAGLRVGLYTSPHLLDWPERVQVAGEPIPWAALAHWLGAVEQARGEIPLTTFERMTAAALLHFRAARAEFLVLEVGLGGRLDATRVVTPVLSLITAIGLDHQALLGDTLAAIAAEKAGILEPGVPALTTARGEAATVITARAAELGAPLLQVRPALDGVVEAAGLRVGGLVPGLVGEHQAENMALAVAAALTLARQGWPRLGDPSLLRAAVAGTRWPGRLQRLSGRPVTWLDGAHNPHAAAVLARFLASAAPAGGVELLFGILLDKDAAGTLAPLLPFCRRVTFVRPSGPRGREPESLLPLAGSTPARVSPLEPAAALAGLRAECDADQDWVLAAGSLHLIGDLLAAGRAGEPESGACPPDRGTLESTERRGAGDE